MFLSIASAFAAANPDPAILSSVDVVDAAPGRYRILLEIMGRIGAVESTRIGEERFVFDLRSVVWDGPLRRYRPEVPGIREYRFSLFSRTPPVTRFVVEAYAGWWCEAHRDPRGLEVACTGPPVLAAQRPGGASPDIAVVRGIRLTSPVEGLDAATLVACSLEFVPEDVLKDGLPHFGAMRDDWMGAPRRHKGLDIYGDKVSVQAAAAGKVVGNGRGEKAGGWIKIDHGSGVETVYVHISKSSVRTGSTVAKGQRIAIVDGPSGNAIQPQLHFELKIDGNSVDPVPYIFEAASDELRLRITRANHRLEILERERASRIGR